MMIQFFIPLLSLLVIIIVVMSYLMVRFYRGKQKATKLWRLSAFSKMTNLGATRSLEVIPLIDWRTSREDLKGEAGVSYLVRTDNGSILFDLGLNVKRSDPSPLLHNMKQLGITVDDFNSIVISHNHGDHVGGLKWQRQRSFSLTDHQIDLNKKAVYTPIPMTYPGLHPICSEKPTIVADGMATIGTIPNQDFFSGWILEQALAVNVQGKGIVLIIGCGHQTLSNILERTEALFEKPLYGLIGGLHYPVTDSRLRVAGIKLQKYIGTCRPPWRPITIDIVRENITLLKRWNPKIVGLSEHDSCDASVAAFRNAFPDAYEEIKVGKSIVIS
jgi:7,8-dihydropterin-6-yl-methyl-4-(beta-D-ribofuranosyl)aminobenzene 5'-phosphate synthase